MSGQFDGYDVPADYVRAIAQHLRRVGASVERWLATCGVPATELARADGSFSFPVFRQLVATGLQLSGEPAMGLFVGQSLGPSTHGMVGAAAVHSQTVAQALDVVERFSSLRTSIISIGFDVDDRIVRSRFVEALPLGDIQRPVLEAVVVSIKHVLDEITMGTCDIGCVSFCFDAPEYADLAAAILGCEVRYGQPYTGFESPKAALDLPLKLANQAAYGEAAQFCERALAGISNNRSWAARVQRLFLERHAQHGTFPTLPVAARMLRVTPRTLHRRLVQEGTSYRGELETVRETLAVEHLRANRFPMQEIAYRLGYTDLANFRRAFKRWRGVTPSGFRDQGERRDRAL